jgi:hypothetical protein
MAAPRGHAYAGVDTGLLAEETVDKFGTAKVEAKLTDVVDRT